MKILGVIPARGGSKGVPKKNIKVLNGIPLISHTIRYARKSILEKILVSTDCSEIAEVAKSEDVMVIKRPKKFGKDTTSMVEVVIHVLDVIKDSYDYIMLLQPTSPLRTEMHINEAIRKLDECNFPETLVSVVKVPHNFTPESLYKRNNEDLIDYMDGEKKYDRRHKQTYYARNGPAILIVKCNMIKREQTFYGKRIVGFEMNYKDSVDIDTNEDFELVESLMNDNKD